MNKLVSVIIPTYNYAMYVREAIESAIFQRYSPMEIIVVDDGSTDNTKEILSDYIAAGKIHYVYQDNRGLAAARNAGLRIAKGEYICLLDSDDLIDKKKMEVQVQCLEEHPESAVVFSDFRFFRDHDISNLVLPDVKYPSEMVFRELVFGKFIPVHTTLIRREVFDQVGCFDETLKECEDSDLWIRALIAGGRFFYIDQILAYYRLHSGQMVKDRAKIYRTFIHVLNRYRNYDPDGVKLAVARCCQLLGRQLIYNDQMKEGRGYISEYMKYSKKKIWKMGLMIMMSFIFSGKTIKGLTERQGRDEV